MKFFFCILALLGMWRYFIVTGLSSLIRGTISWDEFCGRFSRLPEAPVSGIVMYAVLWVVPPFFYLSCLVANCGRFSRLVRMRLFIVACVAGALFMPLLLRSYPQMPRDACVLLVLWAISLWLERKGDSAAKRNPAGRGDVVILDAAAYREFTARSNRRPEFTPGFTPEMLLAEFEQLESALKEELSGLRGRYEIGDDWMENFFHCGGVYSNSLVSPAYVNAVKRAIARLPHAREWYYHTVCELDETAPAADSDAEFYIHDGKVYAPDDGNDYVRLLGS
ncbi:MAG: hypothetical protein HPZ91_20560 [Lentisphaeria bacterium]|nr:hypothetical protein [Lentisphaeria bacterium]